MKIIIILGLAGLLTYGCTFNPVPKPDEKTIKQSVDRWTFGTVGLPKRHSQTTYLDANEDGRIDGMVYTEVSGGGAVRLLAYDTTQIKYYERYYHNLDRSLIMTPTLDSTVNKFMDAAKELRWQYELERYKQQKHPR